ncbi:hypothetical protein [Ralstonia pseudosolanacearum]|uniref:hypothetical protein n=1 Tax=Ralstonia pseudosolanacearum TaxID=1310165 RepID=UPI001FF95C4F|nr:hypothetical protein [Ralstonia pseudosolanacearum]
MEAGWLVGSFALIIAILGPFMVIWLARFDRRKVLVGPLLVSIPLRKTTIVMATLAPKTT